MSDLKKLRQKNYELSKKLTPGNQEIFTNIDVYLTTSLLGELEVEEIIQDILDMFLEAQQRGEEIEKVIGEDFQAFCDSIIESARPAMPRGMVFLSLELIIICFGTLWVIDLVCNIIFELFATGSFSLDYQVSLGILITSMIFTMVAIWMLKYVGKTSFNKGKDTLFLLIIWVGVVALGVFISRTMRSYILFTMKIYYLVALFIGLYLLAKAVNKALIKQE